MSARSHLKVVSFLTMLLESRFKVFGFKFGLDPIIGLVPWVGDAVTAVLSGYIIWVAHKNKVPMSSIKKMYRNLIFDFILGLIPIVGDISDFVYKSNTKNYMILKQHFPDEILEGK